MMKIIVVVAVLILPLAFFFAPNKTERYLITGSSTVTPVMQKAQESLEKIYPELLLDIQTGGSTRGIRDAHAGEADMGMASRSLKPGESEGISCHTIAFDGIAIVAHASNPVQELTSDQVRKLYRKELSNWQQVGGNDSSVHIVNKAEGRATLEVFLKCLGLKVEEIKADSIVGDNAQGVRLVTANPNALGYVSVGEAMTAQSRGEPIKLLTLDGVQPTLNNIASGLYTLQRPLNLLIKGEPTAADRKILDFLRASEGREILQSLGFVPEGAQ